LSIPALLFMLAIENICEMIDLQSFAENAGAQSLKNILSFSQEWQVITGTLSPRLLECDREFQNLYFSP